MLCKKCGKQNEAGDLFCTECGNDLRATEKASGLTIPKKAISLYRKSTITLRYLEMKKLINIFVLLL